MVKRLVGAVVVLAVSVGFVFAEEFSASITKIEDGKVTFHRTKFVDKKLEKGEKETLPLADKVKVMTAKFAKGKIEPGDELPEGLKNERLQKIGEKGVGAQIVTNGDGKKITEIRVFQFGKKKKDA
jgi:hypothetical protein